MSAASSASPFFSTTASSNALIDLRLRWFGRSAIVGAGIGTGSGSGALARPFPLTSSTASSVILRRFFRGVGFTAGDSVVGGGRARFRRFWLGAVVVVAVVVDVEAVALNLALLLAGVASAGIVVVWELIGLIERMATGVWFQVLPFFASVDPYSLDKLYCIANGQRSVMSFVVAAVRAPV
jgi:hypothetical protein